MVRSAQSTRFGALIIGALLTFSLVRLVGVTVDASLHGLQMDYSAFYTAGRAVNAGLSPYVNHVDHVPPIWDGISEYRHSRFLYPPLVATLIAPLARLPFPVSKVLWSILSVVSILAAVLLSARHLKLPSWQVALIVSLVGMFHPFLTEIERGQIDGIILFLLTSAIVAFARGRTVPDIAAGVLLACATLLKLHCVFFVPFLLLRRKWHALTGFAAGALLLMAASLWLNGPQQVHDYLFQELPRISRHGEGGDSTMRLAGRTVESIREGAAEGMASGQGQGYLKELFSFRTNASLVRVADFLLSEAGMAQPNPAVTSGLILLSLILILWMYHRPFLLARSLPIRADFVYWQIVLVVILISGPMTWAMNLVWFVVTAVIAVSGVAAFLNDRRSSRGETISLFLLVLGLAVAAMPDDRSFSMWLPLASPLFAVKYTVAELLVFGGLVGYTRQFEMDALGQGDVNGSGAPSVAWPPLGSLPVEIAPDGRP